MTAPVYIHLGNADSGEVDAIGPFDFAQVTHNYLIRVRNTDEYDDDLTIATYRGNRWVLDDGSEWTDLTISTQPRETEG